MVTNDNVEEFFGSKDRHDAWVAEAIWGHRIERQSPEALLLEFLGMAEGMFRQEKLLAATRPGENVEYLPNRCLQLRNLLFNNPRIEEVYKNARGNSEEGWRMWLPVMQQGASTGPLPVDFSYLCPRFDEFAELVSVVRLLRRISMEPGTERGWTTQFIFPIGPAALYEALGEKGDGFERNRVVFTRTGELAYLMLSRASESLRKKIRGHLASSFDPKSSRNRLLMRLMSEPEPDKGDRKGGTYLPYKTHPAYDRLAEDIKAILSLNLPDQDSFQYLQPLLAFHVYLYGLETSHHHVGGQGLPAIVCEILAPKSDLVRKAAVSSYLENDSLGEAAVRHFIKSRMETNDDLQRVLANPSLDAQAKTDCLADHLRKTFAFKKENELQAIDAAMLKQRFENFVIRSYKNGTGDGLSALAVGCGLVSKRGTNRYRYAPRDDLLRALVLANVGSAVEESVFLRQLYNRYRIIIGPNEAKSEVANFDDSDFKKNRDRLAQHLIGMGLARRMSDACTYVLNPMDYRA